MIPTATSSRASGPAPKTMGIGPIKITPPTLPDPSKNKETKTITAMPTAIRDMPNSKIARVLPETLRPASSASSLNINFTSTTKTVQK